MKYKDILKEISVPIKESEDEIMREFNAWWNDVGHRETSLLFAAQNAFKKGYALGCKTK
jgi:hypothetical protein